MIREKETIAEIIITEIANAKTTSSKVNPFLIKHLLIPILLPTCPTWKKMLNAEDILYVAMSAYESVTGNKIPNVPISLPDLGEGWDFEAWFTEA